MGTLVFKSASTLNFLCQVLANLQAHLLFSETLWKANLYIEKGFPIGTQLGAKLGLESSFWGDRFWGWQKTKAPNSAPQILVAFTPDPFPGDFTPGVSSFLNSCLKKKTFGWYIFPKIYNFMYLLSFFTDYKPKGEAKWAVRKHIYNWNIMQMFFLEFSIPSPIIREKKIAANGRHHCSLT